MTATAEQIRDQTNGPHHPTSYPSSVLPLPVRTSQPLHVCVLKQEEPQLLLAFVSVLLVSGQAPSPNRC